MHLAYGQIMKRKNIQFDTQCLLVTGAAGFIGARVAALLAERGEEVLGIDNINDYYDTRLKYGRLRECGIEIEDDEMAFCKMYQSVKYPCLRFMRMSIEENSC